MEVKPSYKQTDVGVIPEDWEVKEIGDLDPFVTSGSRGWAAFYSERGSPFIRITNLSRTCIYPDLRNLRFVKLAANDSEAARTQLRDGDILISITADIGIVGHVTTKLPKPAYINQHIALVRFDSTRTNSRFISYFLASENPQKLFRALTDSGAKAGMNLTTVQQIRIALPPTKAEQEAIAGALSDADALIESLDQLLTKKRQLKRGAMQELLTGKKRLPRFRGDWETRVLKKVIQIPVTDGPHLTPRFLNDGVPFLSVNNLVANRINLSSLRYISKEDHAEFSRKCRPQKGDVLLGKAASVGRVAIVDIDMEFNIWSPIALIRVNNDNIPRFVYYSFQTESVIRQIELLTNSSSQGNIGMGDIERLVLLLPEKEEQQAIADILSDMDAEIAALEAKLAQAHQLKEGMMQELLTGRIRLA